MPLTPKQQRFVAEYLVDLNATQAAVRAGYKKDTAYSTGHENLKKPEIADAIREAQGQRAAAVNLDAEYVLRGLKREAEDRGEGASHSARVAALAHLGKHLGMFVDKLEVKGTGYLVLKWKVRRADGDGQGTGTPPGPA